MILLLLACTGTPDSTGTDTPKDTGPNTDCYNLSPEACAQDSSCTVLAGELVTFSDTAGGCYTVGTAEPMGCMPAGLGCGAAITYGINEDGCYQFRSTCTPQSFTTTGGNVDVCGANSGLEECQ